MDQEATQLFDFRSDLLKDSIPMQSKSKSALGYYVNFPKCSQISLQLTNLKR
jgi:hypothetical protein